MYVFEREVGSMREDEERVRKKKERKGYIETDNECERMREVKVEWRTGVYQISYLI